MKKQLWGCFFGVICLLMGAVHVQAATYYVDATDGSDSNNGLATSTAWQSLTPINAATFAPGDSVYFKRGQTFTGKITLSNESGTSGSPITFGAYGEGDAPVINSVGETRSFDLRNNASYIIIEDLELRGASTEDILMLSGVYTGNEFRRLDFASSTRGINLTGGTSVGLVFEDLTFTGGASSTAALLHQGTSTSDRFENITVTGFQYGLQFTVSTATSTDLEINGFTVTSPSQSGILLKKLDGAVLQDITVTGSGVNGIYFQNGQKDITLDQITITNGTGRGIRFDGVIENLTLTNATVTGQLFEGIYFLPSAGATGQIEFSDIISSTNGGHGLNYFGLAGAQLSIADSTFNTNGTSTSAANGLMLLGSGFATTTNTIANENSNDGFNIRNSIHAVFDGVTSLSNGLVGSVVNGDGDGISWHNTSTGVLMNSVIKNNKKSGLRNIDSTSAVLYNNLFTHESSGTIALISVGTTSSIELYNNTLYNGSGEGIALEIDNQGTNILYNNIVSGFNYGLVVGSTTTMTEDYNLIFGAETQNWFGRERGTHSLLSDPQFVDPTNGDFQLKNTSPALNSATSTMYAAEDILGNPIYAGVRDLGAYELQEDQYIPPTNTAGGSRVIGRRVQTNTNEAQEIEILKAQILKLQAVLEALRHNQISGNKIVFTRNLKLGDRGSDVLQLQKLLNTQGFVVASTGPGSQGFETEVYGFATEAAVKRLQQSWGIVPVTGYFGPLTRQALVDRGLAQ